MKLIRIRVTFEVPYRLRDDQAADMESTLGDLRSLWRSYVAHEPTVELVQGPMDYDA